jgi:hypothetical protein
MNSLIAGAFLMISSMGFAAWEDVPVKVLKERARKNLLQRKQGFDAYQRAKRDAEKRRMAEAHKMKAIRQAYQAKRERTRRNFVRVTEPFPEAAYRQFLQQRRERRRQIEQARVNYVEVQDELEKVFKNEKYKIDENKEFDL